jgi:biopolymer transport protein ExbB
MNLLFDQISDFTIQAMGTWARGGWIMVFLAILSMFAYYTALELYFKLLFHPLLKDQQQYSNGLIDYKGDMTLSRKGHVQKLSLQYHSLRDQLLHRIKRRIKFLAVIISTAPLMGLLGTVLGMLNMFNGMLTLQSERFDHVAGGIYTALITTQTGLIIAIPAYFLLSLIHQKRKQLELSLHQIEQKHIKNFLRHFSKEASV